MYLAMNDPVRSFFSARIFRETGRLRSPIPNALTEQGVFGSICPMPNANTERQGVFGDICGREPFPRRQYHGRLTWYLDPK